MEDFVIIIKMQRTDSIKLITGDTAIGKMADLTNKDCFVHEDRQFCTEDVLTMAQDYVSRGRFEPVAETLNGQNLQAHPQLGMAHKA